jgi:hypothetical protein
MMGEAGLFSTPQDNPGQLSHTFPCPLPIATGAVSFSFKENTMRKRLCILLFTAGLATVLAQGDRKPFPYRWVRIASNLRDDSEVERIRQLVTTASEHGLNGIAFSAGLDQLDQKTPRLLPAGSTSP